MAEPTPIEIAELRQKAGALQAMQQLPGWDIYKAMLAQHEAQAVETLVQGGDPSQFKGPEFWRGAIQGLRMAAAAPVNFINYIGKLTPAEAPAPRPPTSPHGPAAQRRQQ
jgi:hypothetical protein